MIVKILFLLSLFLNVLSTHAITITQTDGDVLFDLTSVAPTEAGDYLNNAYTQNSTLLTINGIPNNQRWRVSAKLSVLIHSGAEKIRVQLRREGDGTGLHLPSGGASNKRLNATTFRSLFTGRGSRFNIPMRTRITRIGVNDDFGTFDTVIEYKVETL